ncbi:MAG: hypothetical protein JST06_08130 [Bacteroidetes bacterium]|nr:hypothetical protein [Bacteroidota bacterium]MBS1628717.1 hypothetical protein [Bacteroidota bacterium]
MAGTVPILLANSITGITGLGHKPIYFVKLNGSPNATLVIKGENVMQQDNDDALVSISWTSKLMKNVNNNQVNSKVMTPAEVIEFMRAARAAFAPNSDQAAHLNVAKNWVKMPKVNNLTDTDYIVIEGGFGREDISMVKKAVSKLSETQAWYDLGKVVAVDIFNGNNDRFDSTGYWVNKGNIMFTGNSVIGLDTWDPASSDGGSMISNLNRGGGFDELRILIDNGRRQLFADACVNSVGDSFSRAMRVKGVGSISLKLPDNTILSVTQQNMKTLFVPYAPDFLRGLTDGATQLKTYLQNKVRQYRQLYNVQPNQNLQRGGFQMGNHRAAQPQPNQPPRFGQHRAPQMPPLPQVPQQPQKIIPQGILDRMQFLGWQV